jgi:hypothetical protein
MRDQQSPLHRLTAVRRNLVPKLDPPTEETWWDRNRPLSRDRSPWGGNPDEYVYSVACDRKSLVRALRRAGYRRNIFSTVKFVIDDGDVSWEQGSYALWPSRFGKYMHHCYFFEAANSGYTFHIHHHKEWNYWNDLVTLRPLRGRLKDGEWDVRHFHGERWHGDPDGMLDEALDTLVSTTLDSPHYAPTEP